MNRNNRKLKSGASLLVMLVVMGGIAVSLGYLAINWFFDYTAAPQEELKQVNNDQIVKEEKVTPKEPQQISKSKQKEVQKEQEQKKEEKSQSSSDSPTIAQSMNDQNLFVVQVGAFAKKSNAQGMVSKLQQKGFSAYITSDDPYRVQTGAFRTEKAAQELSSKLKENGFSVYIKH
ncbi:hypothetical protein JCM16358_09870 [Halanaerocella petrolearia]